MTFLTIFVISENCRKDRPVLKFFRDQYFSCILFSTRLEVFMYLSLSIDGHSSLLNHEFLNWYNRCDLVRFLNKRPLRNAANKIILGETIVSPHLAETEERLRELIDFLISNKREVTIRIEGNKASYTSRIVKADYGDPLTRAGKGNQLIIEKLTPETGNALLKLSPKLIIQFPLRDQNCQFDVNYLGENTDYPHKGLTVSFPESVRIEERRIYDRNELNFLETDEEEKMKKPGIGSLEDRIEKLEHRNRLLGIVGIGTVIVLVLAVLATYVYPRTSVRDFKAQNFIVQDVNGITRAFLGVDNYDTAGLFINSQKGEPRFVIYIKPNGEGVLRISDRMNARRFIVSISPEGDPSVSLLDKDGNALAILP